MTRELKEKTVRALLIEKNAYETKLAAAESDEEKEKWSERLDAVVASLRDYGHKASAPSKRAEKRPAAKGGTRAAKSEPKSEDE